jgi:nicotine blue oxidoreductase
VKLSRAHWAEALAAASGDEGARRFLNGRSDVALIEIGDVADGRDIDFRPG